MRRQTITMTATGFSGTAPTTSVTFTRIGRTVTCTIPAFSGTSNATSMTLTGSIPAWALPTANTVIAVYMHALDSNGDVRVLARLSPSASTTIVFSLNNGGGGTFTASGTKGIGGSATDWKAPQSCTYTV